MGMDKHKKAALEAAGFAVGSADDFLGLSDDERQLVQTRLDLGRATRQAREKAGLTQAQLAAKMGSSQSRIAKIEAGAGGVSFDLAFKAVLACGQRPRIVVEDLPPAAEIPTPTDRGKKTRSRAGSAVP